MYGFMENSRRQEMIVLGYIIAGLGAVGLCGSVAMEVIKKEPVYMLLMKVSSGVLGIGGVLLGIAALQAL
jgi:hypothetical protein